MFKKTISLLVAVIYLWVVGGVVLSMHYCGGEQTEISTLVANQSDCCEGMPEKSDCCHDKLVAFKLNNEHFFTQAPQPTEFYIAINQNITIHPTQFTGQSYTHDWVMMNQESPPEQNSERYKLLSVFII